jgi:two-component system response regulator NreC
MISVVAFSPMTDDSARPPAGTLSKREGQVMRMLAAGHTNKEIGGELGISVRTVEMHRERVLQKLKLSSRADIVRYALARGLLHE